MDRLNQYKTLIKKVLEDYAKLPYSYGDLQRKLIISEDSKSYLLMTLGWENDTRVHGCLIHLEIISDRIWIHRDGTEDGIANDLVRAGISKSDIVLGFHPPEIRPFTEFATG